MASLNKVFLIGNLTRDPEVRYTGQGTACAKLGLAVNRTYQSQTGERKEDVCFVDLVMWAKQAELAERYLKKGRPIFVEGRLSFSSWQGQDGQKRSKLEVTVERFQFLGAPPGGQREPVEGGEEQARGPMPRREAAPAAASTMEAPPEDDLQLDPEVPF